MTATPHHDGSELYVSNPAPALGDTVAVFVRVPRGTGVSRVHLRRLSDGEPVFASAVIDRRDRTGDTWWRAELPVRNPVTRYRFLLGTTTGVRWLTGRGVTRYDVPDSTDFRLVAHPPAPAWASDAIIYQIFPDRFARSVDRDAPPWATRAGWDVPVEAGPGATQVLYGGDLDGIVRRLDHIAELGANTLYLTPFFPGRSNHRYDATSFDRVDPLLGGDEALARLAAAVHARGWRLLGDLTTNHTGVGHPWVSERPDFYYRSSDGGLESWLGVPDLPKLNWGNADLREAFAEIVRRWIRGHGSEPAAGESAGSESAGGESAGGGPAGGGPGGGSVAGGPVSREQGVGVAGEGLVSGELGVGGVGEGLVSRELGAGAAGEGPVSKEQRDGLASDGPVSREQGRGVLDGWRIDVANMTGRRGADDFTHEVAALVRRAAGDGLVIAEHGHDAGGDLDTGGWHGTMNYAGFTRPVWSWLRAGDLPFRDFLGVPEEIPRQDAAAVVATMSAFAAGMSWRSWTASWQLLGSHDTARIRTVAGDAGRHEVAAGLLMTLPGTPMIFAGDEFGVTGADNESARAPMPWDKPDHATFAGYRELIGLRRSSAALRRGGLRWVYAAGDILAFLRESVDETVLVLASRAGGERVRLTGLPPDSRLESLYGGDRPLYTGSDGSTAIDAHGPAFRVWVVAQ